MKTRTRMKFLFTFLLLIACLVSNYAQEKVSSIVNVLSTEQVQSEANLSYIKYDDKDYALYRDLTEIRLIDINDPDAPILKFPTVLECYSIAVADYDLSNHNNKIYIYSDYQFQEINFDKPNDIKRFSFQTLLEAKVPINIRNEYMVGFEENNGEMKIEVIDLSNFTSALYTYDGFFNASQLHNRLLIGSSVKLAEIDMTNGDLHIIHEGPILNFAQNISELDSEMVFRNSDEYFLRYNLESKITDTICHFTGHQIDNAVYNSKNNVYYKGQHYTAFEDFVYGINKNDCNFTATFQDLRHNGIPESFSENGEDIIVFKSPTYVVIYNETIDTSFRFEIEFGNSPQSLRVDNMYYLFGFESGGTGRHILHKFDLINGLHSEIVYSNLGIGGVFRLVTGDDSSLVILNEIGESNSIVKLSVNNDDFEIRNISIPRDYGIIHTTGWKKHGSFISANLLDPDYRLLSMKNELLNEVPLPDFKKGYYQWNDFIAGMAVEEDMLFFRIFDRETETVIEEEFISSFANKEEYKIVKIGDVYYELLDGRFYQRFPENDNIPSFYIGKVDDIVLETESEIYVVVKDSIAIYSLMKLGSNGIDTIYNHLPDKNFSKDYVWLDDGQRLVTFFKNGAKKETLLISFDTQTGDIILNELYPGRLMARNSYSTIDGWMTFEFEHENDEISILATNGKGLKKFELADSGHKPYTFFQNHYTNGLLFFRDQESSLIALDQGGTYIDVFEGFEGIYSIYDALFVNDKYYFIVRGAKNILIYMCNLDFTEIEQLHKFEVNYCGENWKPQYLGNDSKGDLLVTINTQEYGNEIWAIDPQTNHVELYADIDEAPTSSFKSVEFYQDGEVYFKAADDLGIIQLYKIATSLQPVNTKEISEQKNRVVIYPNPVDYRLLLDIPLSQIVIRNMSGVKVYEQPNDVPLGHVEVPQLASGIYFLDGLNSDGVRFVEKFVKI